MADNVQALVVPAALGRFEAFFGSALAALSLREALVLALDSSRPSAHPFASRDAFANASSAGLLPLAPRTPNAVGTRFHILEQGGPTLSNNRWSLGATSTLGMHVAWTPAGERARVRTCTPPEAQRLAARHDIWWWRKGRDFGLTKGPFALPLAPWDVAQPLGQLRVGDSLTSHHAATLQLLPGALLGQAAGLSLATALHLGVEGALLLGTLAGIVRIGVGLHVTRPSWLGQPPLGISVTRLGASPDEDRSIAAPKLPEGDVGDAWWDVERRLFVAEDALPELTHLAGESEAAATSLARARRNATLLEVALVSDDGAPWVAPSIDVPLLTSAHVGYGWRRGRRSTWLLDDMRASGRLVMMLLRDAQSRSEIKNHHRVLPQAVWEAELLTTSHSSSCEFALPGVSLGGIFWGSGQFDEEQTFVAKLRRQGTWLRAEGVARTEEVVRFGLGRRTSTLMSWGAPRKLDADDISAAVPALERDRAEVLEGTHAHAEWHGLFSEVRPRAAVLLASTLTQPRPEAPLAEPRWAHARKGLRLNITWRPKAIQTGEGEARGETHEHFVARHTPFSLRRLAHDLSLAAGAPQMDARWAQTESLFVDARWFIALIGLDAPTEADVARSRALSQKLKVEEQELRQDPVLGALAPRSLAEDLAASKALRAQLHRIHCTHCGAAAASP